MNFGSANKNFNLMNFSFMHCNINLINFEGPILIIRASIFVFHTVVLFVSTISLWQSIMCTLSQPNTPSHPLHPLAFHLACFTTLHRIPTSADADRFLHLKTNHFLHCGQFPHLIANNKTESYKSFCLRLSQNI